MTNKVAVLKECIHLRNGEFLNYLKEERANILEMCAGTDDEKAWHKMRGEASRLKDLIDLIEGSKESYEKATTQKPNMSKVF